MDGKPLRLMTLQPQYNETENTITDDDGAQNPDPLSYPARRISERIQDLDTGNLVAAGRDGRVHAVVVAGVELLALVRAVLELVDHHELEDVGLVVDVVEDVAV